MSHNNIGEVIDLFISIKDDPKRLNTEVLHVNSDGVLKDKFYSKDKNRAILITSLYSYELAKNSGINMPYGSLGENIIIDYNIYNLLPGDRFKISDITFEITQNCTLCNGLSKVNAQLPKLLKDGRGVFVKAITEGYIQKGNKVSLLKN